ncbi:MAG: Na(+)/H(+) antiporter subunit D [Vicinamibacterales bacterium]|nr:Na(+)/H(+) antiporter subunit D [Vicinamibacterales bacterium]
MIGGSAQWHPVIPLLLAALAMPLLGIAGRRAAGLTGSVLALVLLAGLPADVRHTVSLLGQDLTVLRADALGRVFAMAFAIYAVIATVYAWSETGAAARAFSMSLAAGGIGVALAGDWLTLFLFWEMLTISSLFLIWQGGTKASLAAGIRYLLLHLAGGTCLLVGILLQWKATGSLEFNGLALQGLGPWLMLVGMLTNAAVPPLHAWLPDAYPRATVFGTVFLCAFTTKSAVYVLARAFPGAEPLVWLGAVMALYGVVFAVLENDIRRLLAYHIISQVGYMVCGVGLGTALAINGASAHAFAHIFYKGLLMMSAGAVIYATGKSKLTELGGLAGPLRLTLVFMLIGAASISGVPLFNGFVSKALVVSAAAYEHRAAIEMMLLVASMGTFLHTGLKLPWFTFFDRAKGAAVMRAVPRSMYVAMGAAALICMVTGVFPNLIYAQLPFVMTYAPYTADHVVGGLQILVGTGLGFWLLRGLLGGEPTRTRDVDLLYRGPVRWIVATAGALLERGEEGAGGLVASSLRAGNALRDRAPQGAMAVSGLVLATSAALVVVAALVFSAR